MTRYVMYTFSSSSNAVKTGTAWFAGSPRNIMGTLESMRTMRASLLPVTTRLMHICSPSNVRVACTTC